MARIEFVKSHEKTRENKSKHLSANPNAQLYKIAEKNQTDHRTGQVVEWFVDKGAELGKLFLLRRSTTTLILQGCGSHR